jgi:hypothetical protein
MHSPTIKIINANLAYFINLYTREYLVAIEAKYLGFILDNIRMDLGEVGWGDVDCIGLAKDRNRWRADVNSVLNLRVP